MSEFFVKQKYDLEERTGVFGERIIKMCREIKPNPVTNPLISQLIRSATSVGANYMEANGSNTKKEFIYKISLCKKEANETKYWLRMLSSCMVSNHEEIADLSQESHELVLIFQKIFLTSKNKGINN